MQGILLRTTALVPICLVLAGCGGGGGNSTPATPRVSVSLTPSKTTVTAGSQASFQATVQGSTDMAVNWLVNGVGGGDSVHGTISGTGVYTAPAVVPNPPDVTITAVAHADVRRSASSQVDVVIGVTISPSISTLHINSAGCPIVQQFTASVTGTANSNVTWSVNGLAAGDPNTTFGSIDATGLYSPPSTIPNPGKFCITATAEADPAQTGTADVSVSAGGPQVDRVRQDFPIFLGTSGGNAADKTSHTCCSGTLGALVTRNGQNFILSNSHVLARSGNAQTGESITQPGLVDNQCAPGAVVANYSEAVPLQNPNHIAFADAALAEILPGKVDSAGSILQLGEVNCGLAQPAPPASTIVPPSVGMMVAKSGRSTGLTCAEITEVEVDGMQVEYESSCGAKSTFTVAFDNQVIIESPTFSASGDSGSLIVKAETAEPTALLFAGDSTTGLTVANPIQDVLVSLQDSSNQAMPSIVGGDPHPVAACVGGAQASAFQQTPAKPPLSLSGKALAQAKAVKSAHLKELKADSAVLGVGIGAGEKPGEAAIVILLEKGKPHQTIPSVLNGVKVRVKTIGRIKAYSNSKCRSLQTLQH